MDIYFAKHDTTGETVIIELTNGRKTVFFMSALC
jgi:hypothetical protein